MAENPVHVKEVREGCAINCSWLWTRGCRRMWSSNGSCNISGMVRKNYFIHQDQIWSCCACSGGKIDVYICKKIILFLKINDNNKLTSSLSWQHLWHHCLFLAAPTTVCWMTPSSTTGRSFPNFPASTTRWMSNAGSTSGWAIRSAPLWVHQTEMWSRTAKCFAGGMWGGWWQQSTADFDRCAQMCQGDTVNIQLHLLLLQPFKGHTVKLI